MNGKRQISFLGAALLCFGAIFWTAANVSADELSPRQLAIAQLASDLDRIHQANAELTVSFLRNKLPVLPQIDAVLKKLDEDAELLGKALEKDENETVLRQSSRFNRICSHAEEQMRILQGILSNMHQQQDSYPLCVDSPYFADFLAFRKESIEKGSEFLTQIVQGQYDENFRREYRSNNQEMESALCRILELLQVQQEIVQNSSKKRFFHGEVLAKDSPIVKEFLSFSDELLKKYQMELEDIKSRKKTNRDGKMESAFHCWRGILQKESEILGAEKRFQSIKDSDAFKAYITAVRQWQAIQKKYISSLLANKSDGVADGELLRQEMQEKEEACREAMQSLSYVQRTQEMRQRFNNLIKECPELSKIEFEPRFEELIKEIVKNDAARAMAFHEKRRVLVTEAEAKSELLQMKMRMLFEEAEQEMRLFKTLSPLGAYDKLDKEIQKKIDSALAELRQQRGKMQKYKETEMELSKRIRLLELKAELMQEEEENLESDYDEAVEKLRNLMERLVRHSNKGNSKDFEDAKNIPLEAPIDNVPIK